MLLDQALVVAVGELAGDAAVVAPQAVVIQHAGTILADDDLGVALVLEIVDAFRIEAVGTEPAGAQVLDVLVGRSYSASTSISYSE